MAHRLFEMIEAPLAALRWPSVYILQDSTTVMIFKSKMALQRLLVYILQRLSWQTSFKKFLDDLQRNCTSIHGIHSTE